MKAIRFRLCQSELAQLLAGIRGGFTGIGSDIVKIQPCNPRQSRCEGEKCPTLELREIRRKAVRRGK
jgi:hypothetical protein